MALGRRRRASSRRCGRATSPRSTPTTPKSAQRAGVDIASRVSAYPSVRAALLDRQQQFAQQPGGAVLDGRDIGTVVAPDADAKLYVTASAEVRAQRRVRELLERGLPAHYDDVLIDIRARDQRDRAATRRRCAGPTTRSAGHQRPHCRAGDRGSHPPGRGAPRPTLTAGGQHRSRQIIRIVVPETREFGPFRV